MTRQDDELVRRYHEASEQEGARPGAHVREAVRAHAQMVAAAHTAAATPAPAAPVLAAGGATQLWLRLRRLPRGRADGLRPTAPIILRYSFILTV